MNGRSRLLAALIGMTLCGIAHGQLVPGCGDLREGIGPFDYRTIPARDKYVVESVHFTPGVETLTRGATGGFGADIAYTLRAMPNHPRALRSMMTLAERERRDPPTHSPYTVRCWFERAVQFAPSDASVHTLFGVYLARSGNKKEALEQLQAAEQLAGEDANVLYNLGLVFLDVGDYEKSLDYAKKAYALGFPLPGLRDRLKRAGKWRE